MVYLLKMGGSFHGKLLNNQMVDLLNVIVLLFNHGHPTQDLPNHVPPKITQAGAAHWIWPLFESNWGAFTDSIWWFDPFIEFEAHIIHYDPLLLTDIITDCPPDVCIKARVFQATGHDQWSRPCRDDGESRQPRDNMGASAVLPRPQDMWKHGVKVSKWWVRHNFYGDKRMG